MAFRILPEAKPSKALQIEHHVNADRVRSYYPNVEAPQFQAITQLITSRGQLDAKGNPDLDGLMLQQQNDPSEAGSFSYVVEQRVVHEDGHAGAHGHGHGGSNERSVVDLKVYDQTGELVSLQSFDGRGISDTERAFWTSEAAGGHGHGHGGHSGGHGHDEGFLKDWPDGVGEFLLFLAGHGSPGSTLKGRQNHEKMVAQTLHNRSTYAKGLVGNMELPRGPITGATWNPQQHLAPHEMAPGTTALYPIGSVDPTKDTLTQVFKSREELHPLPGSSLIGLSFTSKATGADRRIFQVTGDELMKRHQSDENTYKTTRVWHVEEYDAHGNSMGKRELVDEQLAQFLNARGDSADESYFENFYWEVPKAARRNLMAQSLGKSAVGLAPKVPFLPSMRPKQKIEEILTPGTNPDLSLNDVAELLVGADITRAKAEVTRRATKFLDKKKTRKIAKKLKDQIDTLDARRIVELAIDIRDTYLETAKELGLPVSGDRESFSWALIDIVEQDVAKPGNRKIRQDKRKIVDFEIGVSLLDAILEPTLTGRQVDTVSGSGFVTSKIKATLGLGMPEPERTFKALQNFTSYEVQSLIAGLVNPSAKGSKTPSLPESLQSVLKSLDSDQLPKKLSDIPELHTVLTKPEFAPVVERIGRLLRRQIQQ